MVYAYNGILFGHKKEGNFAISKNIDGPWGCYAMWNNSVSERQTLYDLTYMHNLKKSKLIKMENRLVVTWGGEGSGKSIKVAKGSNFQIKDKFIARENYVRWWMLTKFVAVIFLHISNHITYLKVIQCYMPILSQWKWNKIWSTKLEDWITFLFSLYK